MIVQRVTDEHGSHIEPPLDSRWSDLEKLQWHAAALKADHGIDFEVYAGALTINGKPQRDMYGYGCGSVVGAAFDYASMWELINGVDLAASIGLTGSSA